MQIIDTHCHYNLDPLFADWQSHWQKAKENGVIGSVVVSTSLETVQRAFEITAKEPQLLMSVGIHPTHTNEITIEQLAEAAKDWLAHDFCAVGETGLDYFRLDKNAPDFEKITKQQKNILRWQIQFANEQQKPLILHVRDKDEQAYWETLEILKKEYQFNKPFVLHCASGPAAYIKEAIKLGGYIGFDGNLTYPNAQNIRDLVTSVPTDRLLIETDAPFLPPQSHRGQICEPWLISETAQFAQEELSINLEQILQNTQQFFEHQFEN